MSPLRAGRLGVCCPGHQGSYVGTLQRWAIGMETRGGGGLQAVPGAEAAERGWPRLPGGHLGSRGPARCGHGSGLLPRPGLRLPRGDLFPPGSVGSAAFTCKSICQSFFFPRESAEGWRHRGALVLFLGTFLDPLPEQVLELNSLWAAPRPPQQRASFLEASLGWQTPLPGPNSKHRQLSRLQASGPGSGQPAGVRDPHSCLR